MADFILDEPHLMDEDGGFAIADGGKQEPTGGQLCHTIRQTGWDPANRRTSVRTENIGRKNDLEARHHLSGKGLSQPNRMQIAFTQQDVNDALVSPESRLPT